MTKEYLLDKLLDAIDKDYNQYWDEDMVLGMSYSELIEARELLQQIRDEVKQ